MAVQTPYRQSGSKDYTLEDSEGNEDSLENRDRVYYATF